MTGLPCTLLQNQLQNCTVATHSASWSFSPTVTLYGFKRSSCVAAYDTPVSWDIRLEDCRVGGSDHAPV